MKTEQITRKARMDLRLSEHEKDMITAAAAYKSMDLSTFVRSTIVEKAQSIIENTHQLQLSQKDFMQVMEILEHPPKPTQALLKAVEQKHG